MSFQVLSNEATVMALLNAFPDVAFLMNVEGDYLAVNAALAQSLGQEADELVGRCVYAFLSPDLAKARRAQVQDVVRTGRPMRFQDQQGGSYLENLIHPILDAQDQVAALAFFSYDITKRVQAEEALREREERYRSHLQELVRERTAELHREISERVRAEKSLRESEDALRRRNRELALLNLAGQVFSSTLDMDWILSTVLEAVRHLMNVAICSIWLRDVEGGALVCQQAAGPQSEILRGWRLAPGVGLAGWTVRHGESLVVPDVQSDERHFGGVEQQTGLELHSLLSVPMRVKEDVIGVLQVADEKSARFDVSDLELLEPLAASAAIAVENARLYRRARQEIAERMRAEQALRRERDFAESLVNTAQAIVLVLDPQGRIVRFNPYMEELSGYRLAEVQGKDWFRTFLPQRDHERIQQVLSRSVRDIQTRGNVNPIVTKDGREREIEWYDKTLKDDDGDVVGVLAVGQDITARMRAQEALRRRNEELIALNAIATTISQSSDLETLLNATLDKVLALTDMDGGALQLLDEGDATSLVLVAHRGLAQEMLQELLVVPVGEGLTGQAAQSGQPVVVAGDAEGAQFIPWEKRRAFACVPLRSKDKVLGVLCVSRHRLQAPSSRQVQLLTAIGHQLGVAVENARLTRQAAEAEILREVNRLRSELIANVSHELRTPLGLIKIFCNLLTEDVELDEEKQQRFLRNIEEEADKLESIVSDLLNLSRMESGQLLLDQRPQDIGQLAQVVITGMQAQSDRHRLVLDFPVPLVALVDAQQIEKVMRNLLENAIKYAPGGGTITVLGHEREGQVVVCVSDEGIGIPVEEQERIFERFYRVGSEVSHKVGGVGLGLSVCQGIVEAHGGRMWVESVPGAGSDFYFTLPAPPGHEPHPAADLDQGDKT
jgi:PAS domain S-box-containing protein